MATKKASSITSMLGLGDTDDPVIPLSEHVPSTDAVEAHPRPDIEKFYVEEEHEEAETEQRKNFAERGAVEARESEKTAAALKKEGELAEQFADAAEAAAEWARQDERASREVLGPHLRRPTDSKGWKNGRTVGFLGGDIAGVTGAALLLGEEPVVAAMQGLSAGVTAVTLGVIGREVRYAMAARAREKSAKELSDAERPYAEFFSGPNKAELVLKFLLGGALVGILLLAVAIFSLRYSTEGLMAGLVFGCLALALGLGSFYNSFDTADDVGELFDNKEKETKRREAAAKEAREAQVIKDCAAAVAEGASRREANTHAGEAAAAAIRRHCRQVLANTPGVAGNGRTRSQRYVRDQADMADLLRELFSETGNGNGPGSQDGNGSTNGNGNGAHS